MVVESVSYQAAKPEEIYKLTEEQVYESLGTSRNGLSEDEAKKRLDFYGLNQLAEIKKKSLILKFLANFYHLFAILLWVGGVLSFVGGMPQLGYAIFAVIVINAIFSFFQEFKAEKATEALKKLLPKQVKVIRDGEHKEILAEYLVPGDLVSLDEGDFISADARVIEESRLRSDNSVLTGESRPVKRASESFYEDVTVTDAPNYVFAGTSVAAGNGKAVVFATAMNTQFGKIASLTQSITEELSPLQVEVNKFAKVLALIAIIAGLGLYFIGVLKGLSFTDRFLFAVGIIVANVPEGLLPTLTLALALGVQSMAKKNALVKKLSSVETLGSTTVICTDKTGTLTQNEMTVREIYTFGKKYDLTGVGYDHQGAILQNGNLVLDDQVKEELGNLIVSMTLCNNSKMVSPDGTNNKWRVIGDPTEGCLLVAAEKGDYSVKETISNYPRIFQLPFDSTRKRMSTVNEINRKQVAYVKGAPKETIALCSKLRVGGQIKDLTQDMVDEFINANDDFAREGLRVLAIAERKLPDDFNDYKIETVEKDLTLLGLVAMMDPPRPEVQAAVEMCKSAGIKIIMITGDYGLTAESIARKIGIVRGSDVTIVTGQELDKMDESQVVDIVSRKNVIFARVSPEHKMKIVGALKDKGEIVAVTGDGVNDAPALKRADIGVAMGITGTDVAKEASEMVLTDDNFASIVNAVEEGRVVFDNIQKFILYIFAHLTPEIVPFLLFVLLKIPLGINVMQILAIDLGTETLPALALGIEKGEPDIMDRSPRSSKESLVNAALLLRGYVFLGLIESALVTPVFFYVLYSGGWDISMGTSIMKANSSLHSVFLEATTVTFLGIVAMQVGTVYASRTSRTSIMSVGFFSNPLILVGIVFEIIFAAALIYLPVFQNIFGMTALPLQFWLMFLVFPPIIVLADEVRKAYVRRSYKLKAG